MTSTGVLRRGTFNRARRGSAILITIILATATVALFTGVAVFWAGEANYHTSLDSRARLASVDLTASNLARTANDGTTSADHIDEALDQVVDSSGFNYNAETKTVTYQSGQRCTFVAPDRLSTGLGTIAECPRGN